MKTDPAWYFEHGFWSDLGSLSGDLGGPGRPRRISVYSLRPLLAQQAPFRKHGEEVERLTEPARFLWAFYIWTLFDQSLHSTDPGVHAEFESIIYVPKPCGILQSYWSIWHPNNVLWAACHYVHSDDAEVNLKALALHALPTLDVVVSRIAPDSGASELAPRVWQLMAAEVMVGRPFTFEKGNPRAYDLYRRSQQVVAGVFRGRARGESQ